MKYRSMTMTAALVLAGGLAVAGCQPNNSGGSSTSADGGSSSSANGRESDVCQADDLDISPASQNDVSGQVIQWIQLSNKTSKACTMDGFAGVDLVGSANGKSDYDWPLGRDSEHYSKITLNPGESAYFGIEYLPWASGDGTKIDVTKIRLTPPNTTTTVTLPFSAAILLQDAATHPGTYLTPIALGRMN